MNNKMGKNNIRRFCPSNDAVGLDIGKTSIKVLELRKTNQELYLKNYAIIPFSNTSDNDLSNAIICAFQQLKSKTKKVIVGITDSLCMCKIIQLPGGLTDQQLYEQIRFDAEQYFSCSAEEICFDFEVLNTNKDANLVDILLIASYQKNIQKYLTLASAANLKVKVIEINSFAILRVVNFYLKNLKYFAVISINNDTLVFLAIKSGNIIFIHEENFDRHELKSFILAIQRVLQLFFANQQLEKINELVLIGEVTDLINSIDSIGNELQLKVIIGNPFNMIKINSNLAREKLDKEAAELFLSCGLAMRAYDN